MLHATCTTIPMFAMVLQAPQFLQWFCWHSNFCNGFAGILIAAMVLLAFQFLQWFCWHRTLQAKQEETILYFGQQI